MGFFDKIFRKIFQNNKRTKDRKNPEYIRNIRLATAALLVLMARADERFTESEHQKINELLKKRFGITDQEVKDLLIECGEKLVPESRVTETLQFIAENFFFDEKYDLMKNLYILMLADSDLSVLEVKLFDKIASALSINKLAKETIIKDVEKEESRLDFF
jgi:uncharacterized tellurite resistance protein B-like protein